MRREFCVILLCVLLGASVLHAELSLPRLFSDGAVLQRDSELELWGWGAPGASVSASFRGETVSTEVAEDGCWRLEFSPAPAGGPHEMVIVSGAEERVIRDILMGDVWVASGQSNMELPVQRVRELYEAEIAEAANPRIRHYEVDTDYHFEGPREMLQSGNWETANPETVPGFSAVGWFFARELERELGVPIGIINASVGGSPAEAWMSAEALQGFPEALGEGRRFRDLSLIEQIQEENNAINRAWYGDLDARDRGLSAEIPWQDPELAAEDWQSAQVPGFWDESGLGPLHGSVWFRRTVDLPAELQGEEATLYLGAIVDADTAWVNGTRVGSTGYQYPPRKYAVPAGLLRTGENVIAIRALSTAGRGEFVPDKRYELEVGERSFDLTGTWRAKLGVVTEAIEPTTFIQWKPMGLFNAMIAPLTQYPVKGVIWYQGESNTGRPGNYRDLMAALIEDWRKKWEREELPFLYVQLANFKKPEGVTGESEWAQLREQQRQLLEIPETAMAVAIDLGEWNDIHPLNKKEVGRRLALAARKLAYGDAALVASGPELVSVKEEGGRLRLRFTNLAEGLMTRDGARPGGFALAGESGGFFDAEARIEGEDVLVWSEAVERPQRVRYAWAHNPVEANLSNSAGLPASPFEADVAD